MTIDYLVPQLQVLQRFRPAVVAQTTPRSATIIGPQAALFRYAAVDEKTLINLGAYDFENDQVYDYPNRPTGSRIDLGYLKLFIDSAKLKYFERDAGGAGTAIVPSGQTNRVRLSSYSLRSNGEDYPAHTDFGDREVQVGDLVKITGVNEDDEDVTLDTRIIGFVADTVAGVVGDLTEGDANAATQGASTTIDTVGEQNAITVSADGSGYDGRADGAIDETYLIEVTRASTGSDLTTARVRVTSGTGLDDKVNVTPGADGVPFAIGDRGLQFTFNIVPGSSGTSQAGDNPVTDLFIGQSWRVRVIQAFTAPTATAAGTYESRNSTTYIVEVVTGGDFGDAKIAATTTNGVDSSGPTTVTGDGDAIAVGTDGVTISFTGVSGLRAGDIYYIEVEGETDGAVKTLVLADDVPTSIRDSEDLSLKLYISKDIQVPAQSEADEGADNWTAIDAEVTINEAIRVLIPEWTVSGEQEALPVEGGTLYLEYRAWLATWQRRRGSLYDPATVPDSLGTVHPDNPLAYGVFLAVSNSNGRAVYFTGVENPDSDDAWLRALSSYVGRSNVYTLVPLTTDDTVRAAFLGHANSESSATNKRWRRVAVGISADPLKAIVDATTTSDDAVALATLADDPDASGTQYTLLSVPAGNAKFLTNGVRAGDEVRYLYRINSAGETVYSTFTVDQVVSETTLRVLEPHTSAISVPQKVEVWRTLDGAELATEIASRVSALGRDRRLIVIGNPTVVTTEGEVPGYFGAAAYAGYRSAVDAHQPLTRSDLTGIIGAGTLIDSLNSDQLDTIAGSGGFLFVRDDIEETLYIRDAITTDNTQESVFDEMFGSNFDDVSYQLSQVLESFIGRTNVTDSTITAIRTALDSKATEISGNDVPDLGPQIISFTIVSVERDAVFRNRVNAKVSLLLPYALKTIVLELTAE